MISTDNGGLGNYGGKGTIEPTTSVSTTDSSVVVDMQIQLDDYAQQIAAIKTSDASLPSPLNRYNNIECLKSQIETTLADAGVDEELLNQNEKEATTNRDQAVENNEFNAAETFQTEVENCQQQKITLIQTTTDQQATMRLRLLNETTLFVPRRKYHCCY